MCCFSQNLGEFLLLPILLLPPLFGGYWWNAMEFGKPINLPFGDGFIPPIYGDFGDDLLLSLPHYLVKVSENEKQSNSNWICHYMLMVN